MEVSSNSSLTSMNSPTSNLDQAVASAFSAQSSNLFQNAAGFHIVGGQFVSGDVHNHIEPNPGSSSASLPIPAFNIMDDTFSEPEVYLRGIAIGDVGRITPEGIFDFFFNIYLPADHPVNDDDVPENFYPLLPYASKDVVTLEYRPGNHVSTSSVRQLVLPSPEEFPGAEFRFHCGVTQGAALALPHGSRLRKLENLEAVREYVATHAESWYEYVKRVRGRDLANGSLYLVTGCEKAQSWGMTSFYGTSEEFQLVLRPSPRTSRYRWSGTPDRPDPSQHKVYDEHTTHTPLNQTTFIHGLSISLGVGIWGKLFGQVGIRDIVESELGNANRSRDTPQAPGSSFFSWSFGLLGGGGSTGGTRHAGESGNVTLSDFPPIGKIFQPAEVINNYLLVKAPNANVVVSHDDDWRDILADDPSTGVQVQTISQFLERLDADFNVTEKDGATFLLPAATVHADSESFGRVLVLFSVLCMYDYESSDVDHLEFRKNEILDALRQEDNGWWAAMRRGGDFIGWIPQTFVQPLSEEMAERLWNIREELRMHEYDVESGAQRPRRLSKAPPDPGQDHSKQEEDKEEVFRRMSSLRIEPHTNVKSPSSKSLSGTRDEYPKRSLSPETLLREEGFL